MGNWTRRCTKGGWTIMQHSSCLFRCTMDMGSLWPHVAGQRELLDWDVQL